MSQSLKILLVDDDQDLLDILHMYFEWDGAEVTSAINYTEALGEIENKDFDIVITDYSMPRMHGLYLLEMIKDVQPDMPVIIMSCYFTDDVREKAKQRNVDMLIGKPFEYETLLKGIRKVMRDRLKDK